jgi:hypothetical protein
MGEPCIFPHLAACESARTMCIGYDQLNERYSRSYKILAKMSHDNFSSRVSIKDAALAKSLNMDRQLNVELTRRTRQPFPLLINRLHLIRIGPL